MISSVVDTYGNSATISLENPCNDTMMISTDTNAELGPMSVINRTDQILIHTHKKTKQYNDIAPINLWQKRLATHEDAVNLHKMGGIGFVLSSTIIVLLAPPQAM